MNFLDDKIKTESPSWPSLLLKNYFDIYTSVHVCICIYVMYKQIYTIHTQLYTSVILYVYMIYTHLYYMHALNYLRRWLGGKESACQCRRHRTHEFDLWVRKIPWRRKRTHSSILAWSNTWTEEPAGLQSMGLQDQAHLHPPPHTELHAHTHVFIRISC